MSLVGKQLLAMRPGNRRGTDAPMSCAPDSTPRIYPSSANFSLLRVERFRLVIRFNCVFFLTVIPAQENLGLSGFPVLKTPRGPAWFERKPKTKRTTKKRNRNV